MRGHNTYFLTRRRKGVVRQIGIMSPYFQIGIMSPYFRDGAWYSSARGTDPIAAALSGCSRLHQGCRLYAVDDDVVWVKK